MFFPPAPPTTAATKDGSGEEDRGDKNTREEAVCTEEEAYGRQEAAAAAASSAVLREFQLALEACTRTGGAAPRTLALLESLLKEDALKRVQDMFALHKGAGPHNDGNADVAGDEMRRGGGAAAVAATGDAFEEAGLSRPMLELEKEWARYVRVCCVECQCVSCASGAFFVYLVRLVHSSCVSPHTPLLLRKKQTLDAH